jgi:hypothetical protein
MPTQEIPREQWIVFFNSFNNQHDGWLATLEVFDNAIGAQQQAHSLPFEGISLDSQADEPESILIDIGKSQEDHITHRIDQPQHIYLQRTYDGADAALEIESADASKTLLRFRSPLPPEFVDDIAV